MIFLTLYTIGLLYQSSAYQFFPAKIDIVCTASFGYGLCRGVLDKSGAFIPDVGELERVVAELKLKDNTVRLTQHWPNILGLSRDPNKYRKYYEFRYNMLIPMRMETDKMGNRDDIPDVNERVISVDDYLFTFGNKSIINLPGTYIIKSHKRTARPLLKLDSIGDNTTSLRNATVISTIHAIDGVYEYKSDYSKLECTMLFCNQKCIGRIDKHGTFTPYPEELERIAKERRGAAPNPKKVFPNQLLISQYKNEAVYEYRFGALIPEVFDELNRPIPERGGTIIDFKDYVYSPTARRIYNLPGRFVLKKDAPAKK